MRSLFSFFCFLAFGALDAGPLFDKFNERQRPVLEKFAKENFERVTGHAFYPFGGPDITYPLLLFPNLDKITLVGLEPVEIARNPEGLAKFPVALDKANLGNLSSLYRRSFFITDQMASANIDVAALILKQIENLGGTEVEASFANVHGKTAVSVTFSYHGKKRTVTFVRANLDDDNVDTAFLKSLEPFDVVFFKAASYLPHQREFSIFRKAIAKNAKMIVQDSTGIPYRHLKDDFDLTLRGRYLKPYKFPGGFEQDDYRRYSESQDNEKLGFCFGYGCGFVPTNVLIATPKNKPEP